MFSFFGIDTRPANRPGDFFGADLMDYAIDGCPMEGYGGCIDSERAHEGFGADGATRPAASLIPMDPIWTNADAIKGYALELWRRVAAQTRAADASQIAAQLRSVKAPDPGAMLSAMIEYGPAPESKGAAIYYATMGAAVAKATAKGIKGIRYAPARMTVFLALQRKGIPKATAQAKASKTAAQVAQAARPTAARAAAVHASAAGNAAADVAKRYIDTAGKSWQVVVNAPIRMMEETDRSIERAIETAASVPIAVATQSAQTVRDVAHDAAQAVQTTAQSAAQAAGSWGSSMAESAGKAAFGISTGTALVVAGVGVVVGGAFFAPEIAAAWNAKKTAAKK